MEGTPTPVGVRERRVHFSDTTLRDGEQMPGASLGPDDKLAIALALAEAGVDSLDAGFPAAAPEEVEALRRIAAGVRGPILSALCRALPADVDAAREALEPAPAARRAVSLFVATSRVHREAKLRKQPGEILGMVSAAVGYARQWFRRVAFSAEDASRTELPFLVEVCREAIDAGATTIGIPDTLGVLTPRRARALVRHLFDHVPNAGRALWAVHFHDDLGLATANTLAAVEEGVHIVQCTVNGIGERAGNAALEELAVALLLHRDEYRCRIGIDPSRLTALSRLVAERTGIRPAVNKAVVGPQVFWTEAGIHQDGLLKHGETYLPFDPAWVGAEGARLVLGKHSGRAALGARLAELGFEPDEHDLLALAQHLKQASKQDWADDEALLRRALARVAPACAVSAARTGPAGDQPGEFT